MTLQVAFAGRDGVVIASDRKATSRWAFAAENREGWENETEPKRISAHCGKIYLARNKALVCAYSGSDVSAKIAQRLVESPPEQFESDFEVLAYLEKSDQFAERLGEVPTREVILAAIPNALVGVHNLWRIYFLKQAIVSHFDDKLFAGDICNTALFFGERYYSSSATVDSLKMLAAHVILEGHRLNCTAIGGLSMLVAKNGQAPHFLEDARLEELRKRSEDISQHLALSFGLSKRS